VAFRISICDVNGCLFQDFHWTRPHGRIAVFCFPNDESIVAHSSFPLLQVVGTQFPYWQENYVNGFPSLAGSAAAQVHSWACTP
jgi:hypothetical protein